jgi:hypothetical protein
MVIARIRRAMPRNPDVMAICDIAEAAVLSRQSEPSPSYDSEPSPSYDARAVVRCPVCEARRAADAASARHRRAAKRREAVP